MLQATCHDVGTELNINKAATHPVSQVTRPIRQGTLKRYKTDPQRSPKNKNPQTDKISGKDTSKSAQLENTELKGIHAAPEECIGTSQLPGESPADPTQHHRTYG